MTQERYDLTPALNADYTFDANGNRLTRQQGVNGTEADEIYRYAAKSNRLLDKDALRQADALPEPVKDVTYDAKQRVRTLRVGGRLKAEYRYDARNLRTKKTLYDTAGAVSEEIYYHYDTNGLLIGESDAQGQVRREYVYLGMMPVAQIDIDAQGQESIVYFLTDHLATPRLGIDQGQAVVWKWESDAYGSIAPSGSATVNLRFGGQYFDAESGWYYNWNRYYLPKEGRYLTSDPIGLKGGLNTYTYVKGNPLRWFDPSGLDAAAGTIPFPSTETGAGTSSVGKVLGRCIGVGLSLFLYTKYYDAAEIACMEHYSQCTYYNESKTDHAKQREEDAKEGDTHRQVGDPNRTIEEGRKFTDADTGHTVHVKGDKVVITDCNGCKITQFKNSRKNTQDRIRSGKWVPK